MNNKPKDSIIITDAHTNKNGGYLLYEGVPRIQTKF